MRKAGARWSLRGAMRAIGLLMSIFAMAAVAAPVADAHNDDVSMKPVEGVTVPVGPAVVAVGEMSRPFAQVAVLDAGVEPLHGQPVPDGPKIGQTVGVLPPDRRTISLRCVPANRRPIAGEISAPTPEPTEPVNDARSAPPTTSPHAIGFTEPAESSAQVSGDGDFVIVENDNVNAIIGFAAALGVITGAVLIVAARNRRAAEDAQSSADAADDTDMPDGGRPGQDSD